MDIQHSHNIIPNIHPLITMQHGENYWFNGCARYAMEGLGEPEFDYWFFSGLTGDNLVQVYSYDDFRGDGATDYIIRHGNWRFIEDVFARCGYEGDVIPESGLSDNREMYLQKLTAHIDKGIPVIFNNFSGKWKKGDEHGFGWGVFVGYENYGKTLLYLTADATSPERVGFDTALPHTTVEEDPELNCWIFVGEKTVRIDVPQIYRQVILGMPQLLTTQANGWCFGAEAFRAWADSIAQGRFDGMKPGEFAVWAMHTVYVCNVATNGSCRTFLERAWQKNPDMGFLGEVIEEYKQLAVLWNGSDGQRTFPGETLESLGGGFHVTLANLQDRRKREAIADKIRECAGCMDRVVSILNAHRDG